MGFSRSTFYDIPHVHARDLTIVAEMKTICDEFEAYGYRRVDAELRHRGIVVNTKKIRRLMREHTLNPKQHRRFIATTDSDHDYPIFPDLAKNMTPDGPNQLWVADITYVAIATGFVYLASSSAWRWSNSSIESQHPIDAALVPPLKRSGDVRHTLTALPALPELSLLLRREPCPCIPLHNHTSSSGKIRRCCVDRLKSPPISRHMRCSKELA